MFQGHKLREKIPNSASWTAFVSGICVTRFVTRCSQTRKPKDFAPPHREIARTPELIVSFFTLSADKYFGRRCCISYNSFNIPYYTALLDEYCHEQAARELTSRYVLMITFLSYKVLTEAPPALCKPSPLTHGLRRIFTSSSHTTKATTTRGIAQKAVGTRSFFQRP